ncbi:MAG: glycosyltransferase [Cyanobacteriota bacterium]|nr:glycosyltransferase [Cyanobacteriota bacterium]
MAKRWEYLCKSRPDRDREFMPSPQENTALEYRATVLQLIQGDARIIVEIDCGDGALGRLYKQIAPDCYYVGIEADWEAARTADRDLDRVLVGSIEQFEIEQVEIEPGTIDCIIYNRSLAFTTDPIGLLQRHRTWLKPSGSIVASFPNAQYWQTLLELLQGKWDARSALSRGYRQWFSLDRVDKLLVEARLYPCDRVRLGNGNREALPPQVASLLQTFQPALETALQIDSEQWFEEAKCPEYVVLALASPTPPRRLLIQTLLISKMASDRVRVYQPDRLSRTIPGVRTISQYKAADLNLSRPDEDKIFIWQRDRWTLSHAISQQRPLLGRGYLTIAEIDDDPRYWDDHVSNDFIVFRACHCIQTSTEPLAELLRQFNPYVKVFPNQLPVLPPQRIYPENAPVTLFFGALNREDDWAEILPALNPILARFGDRVCVRVIHDRAFFNALQTPHKSFEPLCPYERYHQILHQCDVAILPLLPTQFNQMKSDLKWLECAGHGVAVLASPTVYEGSIIEGKTGLIYRNMAEFESKLHLLLDRADFRQQIAANAYRWVREHRLLSQHYRQRYDWYVEMLDRFGELHEALRERVLALFV